VPKGKSDIYVSSRRIANSIKVSLHEPGPARFALTSEFVRGSGFQAPDGEDARLAKEWERPRTSLPDRPVARPLSILVPWDEVQEREGNESGDVVFTPPPPEGTCVHFDVTYVAPGVRVTSHPGARSMGTEFVGQVELENGERVYVTSIVRAVEVPLRRNIAMLRSARVVDATTGKPLPGIGVMGFGREPDPDGHGTFLGTLIDVTRPDEREDLAPRRSEVL
jgi:hypothetical protein